MAEDDISPAARAASHYYHMNNQSDVIRRQLVQVNAGSYGFGPLPQAVHVKTADVSATAEESGHVALEARSTIMGKGVGGDLKITDTPLVLREAVGIAAGDGSALGVGGSIANARGVTSERAYPATTASIAEAVRLDPLTVEATVTLGDNRRTIIVRTVMANQAVVQLTALSFLNAIELKIETLRSEASNSKIAEFDDLKRRLEDFLSANAKRDETPIADATLSIADGLRRWWTEKHVSICERTLDMTLFGVGLAFCGAAGVLAVPTAVTVGALVGRKDVVEALKQTANILRREGDNDKS